MEGTRLTSQDKSLATFGKSPEQLILLAKIDSDYNIQATQRTKMRR